MWSTNWTILAFSAGHKCSEIGNVWENYGILDNKQWFWKILGIKFSRLHKLLLIGSFNPLTPGAFCEKGLSWWFLGWISVKLPLIWSKMHLHHDSLVFLPLASRFVTFHSGMHRNQKVTYVFWFFDFWNFFSPFPFLLFFCFLLQWLTFYWACG